MAESSSQPVPVENTQPQPGSITQAVPSVAPPVTRYAGVDTMNQKPGALGVGSLANTFDLNSPKNIDVVQDFPWTLSVTKGRKDIPFIRLIEHRNEENLFKRQFAYYAQGISQTVTNLANKTSSSGLLSVYDEVWPDNPTNWSYNFPYFNKTHFELNTPLWDKVDEPGAQIKTMTGGVAGAAQSGGFGNIAALINAGTAVGEAAFAAAELGLKTVSPLVGTADRPRIFTSHSERSITIQFPLYNTSKPDDWKGNRDFFYRFASQNLFNKRDFITGLPPVWYRVYVPGQYYSHASCVTNFNVENLGNTRLAYEGFIIPDAYQISITLTEMLMPSLNQFQAVVSGDANNRVTTTKR